MKPGMMLRIKRVFTNNVGLKLLAVVFSVALWLIVVNVDDPTQTRTFSAPVTVINEEVLTDAGRYYTIPDGNNTVSFRVTAKRSVIERLSNTDFTATADMNFLENDSRIPVSVTVNNENNNVTISSKRLYLQVIVGNEMMMKHEISVKIQGTPSDGCVVASTSVEPQTVTLTGPQEVLNTVSSVAVYVDIKDANGDIEQEEAMLHFLDEKGNEVDRSKIKVDHETAKVKVEIARLKQVDVNVNTSGELPEGLYLDDISVNPSKVSIMGSADKLNDITVITIPGSAVNLSEIQQSTTTTVDLNAYLPEGVSVASGESSQVEISIRVSGDSAQKFVVPTANIAVRNLAGGLQAEFADKNVTIEVSAGKDDMAKISAANITGFVDASGLAAGEHTLQVNLDLDAAYTVTPVTVKLTIKE